MKITIHADIPEYLFREYKRLGVGVSETFKLDAPVLVNVFSGIMHTDLNCPQLGSDGQYCWLHRVSNMPYVACRTCEAKIKSKES